MAGPIIASDRPPERTLLYPSVPVILAPILVFGLVAYFSGKAWVWWVIGICVVIAAPFAPRRIDLDSQGITYVPLVPLWRRQSFRWAEIGAFERKTGWRYSRAPSAVFEAPILSGRTFRILAVFRSSKLTLTASYGASPLGGSMTAEALLALVDSYRAPAAGGPS